MSGKADTASMDRIVSDALQKMKDLTEAASSYEVDRTSGLWSVRRATKTGAKDFSSDIVAHLTGARAG